MNENAIDEIYPDTFISNITFVRNNPTDRFDTIVTVCQDDVSPNVGDDVDYHWFNLADGVVRPGGRGSMDYELFEGAATTAKRSIFGSDTTLVHCHAGVSRSASVTAAAIAAGEGLSYYDVIGRIRQHRDVHPHPNLVDHAKRFIEDRTDINHRPFL